MTNRQHAGRCRWALCLGALAALHVSGCQVLEFLPRGEHLEQLAEKHHQRRQQTPAAATVEVGGLVAAPGRLEVGSGTTLAEALRQVGGYAPAANAPLPAADVLVLLMRDGGRYYYSLPLVEQNPAVGAVMLRARDRLAVLGWSSTDFARGLKFVSATDSTLVKKAVNLPPLPDKSYASFYPWVVEVRKLTGKKAIEPGNAEFLLDAKKLLRDRVELLAAELPIPESQRPDVPVDLTDKSFPLWVDRAVKAIQEHFASQAPVTMAAPGRAGWQVDWQALQGLHGQNPRFKDGRFTLDIPFASDDQAILSPALRTVTLPKFTNDPSAFHPQLEILQDKKLGDVVMLRRNLDGRPLEFMLAREGADAQGLLSRVLVFGGDEVQVTSPLRNPMILSSLVAPALMQQIRGADGHRIGQCLQGEGDCRLVNLAGVPVVGNVLEASRRQALGVTSAFRSGVNTTLQNTVGW